jgi:uncharacterized protein YbcV (DUF1398 family)
VQCAQSTRDFWSLPAWQNLLVTGEEPVPPFDRDALSAALRVDRAGGSSFPEFLVAAWRAGVVRYAVNFEARTVFYYGRNDEVYVEVFNS